MPYKIQKEVKSTQNSQAMKNGAGCIRAYMKSCEIKACMKSCEIKACMKSCEIKGGSQEMDAMMLILIMAVAMHY